MDEIVTCLQMNEVNPINWINAPEKEASSFRGLEVESQAADDPLRRAADEQLVVDGLVVGGIAQEIPYGDEHLPPRCGKVHERQRLADLHVEP